MLNQSQQFRKKLSNNNRINFKHNLNTVTNSKLNIAKLSPYSKNKERSELQTRSTQRFVKSSNSTRYDCNFNQHNNLDKSSNVAYSIISQIKKVNSEAIKNQSKQNMEKIQEMRQRNLIQNKLRRFRVIKSRNAGRLKKDFSQGNKQNTKRVHTQEEAYYKKVIITPSFDGRIINLRSLALKEQEAALQQFEKQLSFRYYLMNQILNGKQK